MRSLDRVFRARQFLTQRVKTLVSKIRALFANGEQGTWYDPSDLTTLFRDAAGTIPVTAVEQPVGLMLDKSKGLALGSELIADTGFDNPSYWTLTDPGTSVIANGVCSLTSTEPNHSVYRASIVSSGKWYKVTYTITVTSGSARISSTSMGYTGVTRTASGTYTEYINPTTGTSGNLSFTTVTTFTGTLDNISVRELPGNHAFQSTSTNRPVLSSRYNMLNNTDVLSTQSVTTRAAKHILSFWGTGSVSMSGSYTGSLVGTSSENRVYIEFTATTGTLTLTVTGSVLKAQLEEL